MKPLGLPEGSVRAILLILLTVGVVFPVFIFVFRQMDIPPTIDKYLTTIATAVILLIREYLGLRIQQQKDSELQKPKEII